MVLDVMRAGPEGAVTERLTQCKGNRVRSTDVAKAVYDQAWSGPVAKHEQQAPPFVRTRPSIDGHMVKVGQAGLCLREAVLDCLGGKPGPVLHPAKPFLLGSGDELAVPDQTSR